MNTQQHTSTQVLIVGAGPAGLGVAAALKRAGVIDILVVDSKEIGTSFRAWPRGMSLLTPSFYSNPFGLTDLNAIDPETSPADFFRTQHPPGEAYAHYLQTFAEHHQLPVRTATKALSIQPVKTDFTVQTSGDTIHAEYLIWAGGQFSHPRTDAFPGAELALHSSRVTDWATLDGDHFTIIGGYESGIDAALNLIALGKNVRLISRGEPWSSNHPDPSRSLSPRTLDRLRELLRSPELSSKIEFIKNTEITRIEACEGFYTLRDQDDFPTACHTRPILANGFHSGLGLVSHLFDHDENHLPIFTEEADESTLTPGLFYTGPSLVHRNSLFCFIYKFRARFGVIAAEIATRLGKPNVDEKLLPINLISQLLLYPVVDEKLLPYLKAGFMNTDLDCCTNCECAIEHQSTAPTLAEFSVTSI
jgi:putative flavoprotein involved in K+ transport